MPMLQVGTSSLLPPSGGGPTITTTSLASAVEDVVMTRTVVANGGLQPYAFSIVGGSLPTNISNINSATGEITGTPTTPGTFNFTVRVTDANLETDDQELSIVITATSSSAFTGPKLGLVFHTGYAKANNNLWPPSGRHGLVDLGVDYFWSQGHYLDVSGGGFNSSFASFPGNAYLRPADVGTFMGAGNNEVSSSSPDMPEWTDDAGWAKIASSMGALANWASRAGNYEGIDLDWEFFQNRGSVTNCIAAYGLTEAQVRAKVRQRGLEVMTAIMNNWSPTKSIFRMMSYHSHFAGTWKEVQFQYAPDNIYKPELNLNDLIYIDFFKGMADHPGNFYIYFMEAAYYKFLQGHPGYSWYDAISWDYQQHRQLFVNNFAGPQRFTMLPAFFVDIDPGSHSQETVQHSVPHELARVQQSAQACPDGLIFYDHQGTFDYRPYASVLAAAPPPDPNPLPTN